MSAAEGCRGEIGGKFRKRPFRKAPVTPYDRPPAAARGIRSNVVEAAAGGRHGWLLKLVDPASRLITRGATGFFASVFQKRLGAPPPVEVPVSSFERRQDALDLADPNTLPEISEQGNKDDRKSRNISYDDELSELEQLLKQKTFTRAEFDHLTELLRSRTVDLAEEDAKQGFESRTSLPAADFKKKEVEFASGQENGEENPKIPSTPGASLMISGEEIASLAEIAKAYMGSRPPRTSVSSSSLRIQTTREATASPRLVGSAPKSSAEPIGSKSVSQSSGVPAYFDNGYMTPKPPGRTAMYKMSRSPYFKAQQTITLKGSELHEDDHPAPSTSNQLTQTSLAFSGGKQVLKRRSSVLENDIGSFGPIRRICQKSNLGSPSKGVTSLFPGKFFPPANSMDNVETSSLTPLLWHEPKYDTSHLKAAETGDEKSTYASVPLQSSEMARKIFQQLDKLVPSPKEKSSEVIKAISRHVSPPKLTIDMLHGQALKSVSEIDSLKIFNATTNGNMEGPDFSSPGNSISPKQQKVEYGPLIAGTKIASEAQVVDVVLVSGKDKFPVKCPPDSTFQSSAAGPSHKKPAFTMQAPEDLLELEDDSNSSRDASGPSATGKEKIEAPVREHMAAISETAVTRKLFPFSSGSKTASDLTLSKEAGKQLADRPAIADVDTGFTFQVASCRSQPPLTPTMPSSDVEKSAPSDQTNVPIFTFSSKTTTLTFSSSVMSSVEPSSLKFEANSNSKGQLFGSMTTSTIMTTSKESESGKAGETWKPGDFFKSVGPMSSSGFMSSAISNTSSFVTSATSSQSNGSLTTSSSTFSVSATPAVCLSSSSAGSIVSTSSVSASTSGHPSISPSALPAVTSFQFGSSSAVSTDSASSAVKYGSTNFGLKPVKESLFGIFSYSAVTSSSIGSSIFGFGASSSSSSSSSSTAGLLSGMPETQYGSETSPFAQSMTNQLVNSSSPTFGLGGSSLGFSSSAFGSLTSNAKPFGSNFGRGSSSTTSSLAIVGCSTAPSSSSLVPSVTSPSLFSSISQSPTSSIFGSVFGSSSFPSTMFTSAASSTTSATMSFSSSSSSPLTFTSSAAATSSVLIFSQATTSNSSVLPFTSFGATTSSTPLSSASPAFGMPIPTVSFGSGSPGNDQMNVEDSMADDTVQLAMPSFPTFGQQSNIPAPNLLFGFPASPSGAPVIQFAGPQPSAFPQTPFQPTGGSFEISAGFSMGSGGADKSGRRFIKAKRDKHRKK